MTRHEKNNKGLTSIFNLFKKKTIYSKEQKLKCIYSIKKKINVPIIQFYFSFYYKIQDSDPSKEYDFYDLKYDLTGMLMIIIITMIMMI